jgi:hypothetical protein
MFPSRVVGGDGCDWPAGTEAQYEPGFLAPSVRVFDVCLANHRAAFSALWDMVAIAQKTGQGRVASY